MTWGSPFLFHFSLLAKQIEHIYLFILKYSWLVHLNAERLLALNLILHPEIRLIVWQLGLSCRTQPNPVFAEDSEEDEEADKEPEWKKRKIWSLGNPNFLY